MNLTNIFLRIRETRIGEITYLMIHFIILLPFAIAFKIYYFMRGEE